MSMIKQGVSDLGVPTSFWKVGTINISWVAKRAQIHLHGYYDEASKIADEGKFIQRKVFTINPEDFNDFLGINELNSTNKNPVLNAYNFIKIKDAFFSDAEDC